MFEPHILKHHIPELPSIAACSDITSIMNITTLYISIAITTIIVTTTTPYDLLSWSLNSKGFPSIVRDVPELPSSQRTAALTLPSPLLVDNVHYY